MIIDTSMWSGHRAMYMLVSSFYLRTLLLRSVSCHQFLLDSIRKKRFSRESFACVNYIGTLSPKFFRDLWKFISLEEEFLLLLYDQKNDTHSSFFFSFYFSFSFSNFFFFFSESKLMFDHKFTVFDKSYNKCTTENICSWETENSVQLKRLVLLFLSRSIEMNESVKH